ncbi:MAG: type II toxin-antitoxin system RelB/DinJ family antitoxin [Patescibacteria group bacterium]
MNTTIQLRIDKATKVSAQKVLAELGLDMSSAMKLFLRTVSRTKSIPFEIRTVNGFTPGQEARMIKETEWAEKHGKRYKNAEELTKHLLS